jgi:hypothetical protein
MYKNYSRNFGVLFSFIIFFIFLHNFYVNKFFNYYILSISIALFFLSFTKPSWLNPFSFLWNRVGEILGVIITPIIITSVFFLLFTPLGFILKIFRVNLLSLKIKKSKESYWVERKIEPTSMKRQF